MDADERLRRARLAAQRLTPATACASAEEAAIAVIGVQAQDLRAAALALRSRVPGLTRGAVRAAPLLRTWTVRGTVHLIAASDRPWLHALLAERNARMFGARFERFGIVERGQRDARGMSSNCVPSGPATGRRCSARWSIADTRRSSKVRSTHSSRGSRRRV